ncbi:AAA family ATPase [Agromyces sp. MMS17-SY077]|uniref:AAA family ATPase n=1 Tax=Agromyces seonyuensis TaxID=2662446 RepID=A0A6I4NSQ5_9MICO|nr:AAA family ATPase [Agromyces seonyuensis]MWB97486.1 AAA family ATPase [Agromyces seonyuensis]
MAFAPEYADARSAAPESVTTGAPDEHPVDLVEATRERWRDELAAVGGRSPLLRFADDERTRIELSTTHPGGLPQFITGNSTHLSNLIRDELALRAAKLAAGAITDKGIELRSVRGIDSVFLAIGLAKWQRGEDAYLAPVLLWPLAIRRYGRDFELKLKGQPFLNPALARELADQFRISLDADAFVALAISNGAFKPQPVIDRLRGLTAHLPWFQVAPRLVVSNFAEAGPAMARDAQRLGHPLIDAVAGDSRARARFAQRDEPVALVPSDERPPSTDSLLLAADAEQEQVVAEIAAGRSIVVSTLPGTGGTQTVVNAIGALVAADRRVLVVGPRRSSLEGIAHRLAQVGLGGAAVTNSGLRRDLIASISRNEKAEQPRIADVDDALVRLRKVLVDYRAALSRTDAALGISVLDALGELARLALQPTAPRTSARLDRDCLAELATGRERVAAQLARAAELGEFRYGPGDSPWYGAAFHTSEEAETAHKLAQQLSRTGVPRLVDRAEQLIADTRLRPFESVAELGVFLRLLLDIKTTLDRFQPSVYDRPLGELIAATAPRREVKMSGAHRRQFRRLALEYVRPGASVGDLHDALRRVQQQRTLWQRYTTAGAIPAVPVGIDDVFASYERIEADLAVLDAPLGIEGSPQRLAARPLRELRTMLEGLAAESEVLANLQERTAVLQELRGFGLDPLLVDLSKRHVPAGEVGAELELAWWQSGLEHLLAEERALLGANTAVLDRLEADFRLVDQAHADSAGPKLAWKLAESWKIGLVDHPEEAAELRGLLRGDRVGARSVVESAPHLFRSLAPVWLSSPYEVPAIPDELAFDTVILVDAGAATFAESLGAIRRAGQVVAVGDPVTQTPTPFETGLRDGPAGPRTTGEEVEGLHAESAFARLSELLPRLELTRSYRAGGEDLAELVNRRFYDGRIESLPWAGSFLGHGSLNLHFVEGNGLPDRESGTVESVDNEVVKVVELVMDHAVKRPTESLMVITASPRHATRVHQAVLSAFAKRTDLTDFILKDRAEPFTVLTLEQAVAQSRDRVIFSVGFGRTPHGRLLSTFGPLGEPGGDRLLAVGMTRARRSMDIVAAFHADHIDDARQSHGVLALRDILQQTEARQAGAPAAAADDREPMLLDLAARLGKRGIRVTLGHRGRLALAASHAGRAVVVETDAALADLDLREALRLRPAMLRGLGWYYLRVHSFELFANPESVAERVAALLGKPRSDA